MSKYVYLFELDSVRKTDEEIIAGQAALYDEIVTNGNIVVLTRLIYCSRKHSYNTNQQLPVHIDTP